MIAETNVFTFTQTVANRKGCRPRAWELLTWSGKHSLVNWLFDRTESTWFGARSSFWMDERRANVCFEDLLDDDVLVWVDQVTDPITKQKRVETRVAFVDEYRKSSYSISNQDLVIDCERTRRHDDPLDWFRHVTGYENLNSVEIRLEIGSKFIQSKLSLQALMGPASAYVAAHQCRHHPKNFVFTKDHLLDNRWYAAAIQFSRGTVDLSRHFVFGAVGNVQLLIKIIYSKYAPHLESCGIEWYGFDATGPQRDITLCQTALARKMYEYLLHPKCDILVLLKETDIDKVHRLPIFDRDTWRRQYAKDRYLLLAHPITVDGKTVVERAKGPVFCIETKAADHVAQKAKLEASGQVEWLQVSPFETMFEQRKEAEGCLFYTTVPRPDALVRGPALHDIVYGAAIVLLKLDLPAYVVLWIVDWFPELELVNHHKKIRLIESVRDSIRRIDEKREQRAAEQSKRTKETTTINNDTC